MAITFLELGNAARAEEHLRRARDLAERHADARLLSEIAEAEARLALARDDEPMATDRAHEALAAAAAGGSYLAAVGAQRTLGRLAQRRGDRTAAEAAYEAAAGLLRRHRSRAGLRDLLGEWAELRSGWGDVSGANELYAEALGRRGSRA
jgi:hypothetical protein